MKNIFSKKITISGARSHWSGNKNGGKIIPAIVVKGLLPNGEPFGNINAEVTGSTSDGGAKITLWKFSVPFGAFEIQRGATLYNKSNGKTLRWFDLRKLTTEEVEGFEILPNYPEKEEFVAGEENFQEAVQIFEKFGFKPDYCDVTALRPIWTLSQLDKSWDKVLEWLETNAIESFEFNEQEVFVAFNKNYNPVSVCNL